MAPIPASDRGEQLTRLSDQSFDLLIVGGGIVGAGIARDAALRGVRTALVEQHDFAFGTSSRSSRLLHGGIRYLAQGRIGLVREASVEKTILHEIAPHLAEPMPFIFPAYRQFSDWPFWQLQIGVKIYDLLCSGKNFGPSSSISRDQLKSELPQLLDDGLKGAVRYFDGFTQDARLVLDTLRSAKANDATLLNYVRFERSENRGSEQIALLHDQESGRRFEARARCIVNATGPWSQQLPRSEVKLRLTKGVHLVFPREVLPIKEAVAITEHSRVLFVIPWGERIIIGTTDTDYTGSPEEVRTSPEDVQYLLRTVASYFPGAALQDHQIISTWAGLRPLIADNRRGPSQISRSHQIRQSHPNWWDVAGGKLTTYRLIAEQTVDQICRTWARPFERCQTAEPPLLPQSETNGISQIIPPPFSRNLVEHYCRNEWALHLSDVMLRRSSWHFYNGDLPHQLSECARWMAEVHGWSTSQVDSELLLYHQTTETLAAGPKSPNSFLIPK